MISCAKSKIRWMSNLLIGLDLTYLNQNKVVYVNESVSDPSLVTCGVPQGTCSILGPLLFC